MDYRQRTRETSQPPAWKNLNGKIVLNGPTGDLFEGTVVSRLLISFLTVPRGCQKYLMRKCVHKSFFNGLCGAGERVEGRYCHGPRLSLQP